MSVDKQDGTRTSNVQLVEEEVDDSEVLEALKLIEKRDDEPPAKRVMVNNEATELQRKMSSLVKTLTEITIATEGYLNTITKHVSGFGGLAGALNREESMNYRENDPGNTSNRWGELEILYSSDLEGMGKQIVLFYDNLPTAKNYIEKNRAELLSIVPQTLYRYDMREIEKVFNYGRSVFMEYLIELYNNRKNAEEYDKSMTFVKESGEVIQLDDYINNIRREYRDSTVENITISRQIEVATLYEKVIPNNAKIFFPNLLYTYWRLATLVVSVYSKLKPQDFAGIYKYPNRYMVNFFDKETSSGKIDIAASPAYNRTFFYHLFPGNNGPRLIGEVMQQS